mmetsp:Transcript_15905/g.28178  ORF Transcript_15905/g.28178 Transcript_15905/m.28178 type:complete len:125 (-) Transcript_15905:913-1287(-)
MWERVQQEWVSTCFPQTTAELLDITQSSKGAEKQKQLQEDTINQSLRSISTPLVQPTLQGAAHGPGGWVWSGSGEPQIAPFPPQFAKHSTAVYTCDAVNGAQPNLGHGFDRPCITLMKSILGSQ